ncbi:MAG: argininosuccinate lyase [Dehalococcoidia bacterium]|nr:argininosuccinate lyase [Dehalococcoidia bacterium]
MPLLPGRVYGHLIGLLTTLKGLPLSYNRDLQEDKEGFFDTVDTLLSSLEVFTGMMGTLKVKAGKMRQASEGNYTLATDIADYLVKKGLAFREAYGVVGSLVKYCIEKGKEFSQLSIKEYRQFSSSFAEDVLLITVDTSVKARMEIGGTAPSQVAEALKRAKQIIEDN